MQSQASAYADVSVVINGAVEEEERFLDESLMLDYVRTIQDEATSHGYLTQVYIHWHEHSPDVEECACLQYEQDHHPTYSFNGPDDD